MCLTECKHSARKTVQTAMYGPAFVCFLPVWMHKIKWTLCFFESYCIVKSKLKFISRNLNFSFAGERLCV